MNSFNVVYELGGKLYVNLTNKCPCSCAFCVRNNADGIGSADSLWLEREPTTEEVISAFEKYNLSNYGEVVFCGYGEPTCALDVLLTTAKRLKSLGVKTRLNTNGLSDLINEKDTAPLFAGLIDTVSISLNAANKQEYFSLCHPVFGEESFDAMLGFARNCTKHIPNVVFTVVDVIGEKKISECRELADKLGIVLRVRAGIL